MIASVDRTIRWAKRCRDEYDRLIVERNCTDATRPLLFGVVQGGLLLEERRRCVEELARIGFDGYGFGGRHVDVEGNFLEEVLHETAKAIPEKSLRFALGIGTPHDIVRCHALGWDMFDCVIPTREGRHGRVFLCRQGRQVSNDGGFYTTENLTAERFRENKEPIDAACDCPACVGVFSRGYIRYLFASGDPLGARLLSLHNLRFYAHLMEDIVAHV